MPTKQYIDKNREFNSKYGINFSIEKYLKANKKSLKPIESFGLAADPSDPSTQQLKNYVNSLSGAMTLFLESKMKFNDEKKTDFFSTFSMSEFINDFEKLALEKHLSDLADNKVLHRDRREFERTTFADISKAMIGHVKGLNESNGWAKQIADKTSTVDQLKAFLQESVERLDSSKSAEDFSSLKDSVAQFVTARNAMEKLTKSRGFFWRIWIGNRKQKNLEKAYLKELNEKLNAYKEKGLTDEIIKTALDEDNAKNFTKATDNLLSDIDKRNQKETELRADSLESAKAIFVNDGVKNQFQTKYYEIIDKFPLAPGQSPVPAGFKQLHVDSVYNQLVTNARNMWEKFEKATDPADKEKAVANGVKDIYKTITRQISFLRHGDLHNRIAAQDIADYFINKYTPVANNENYAKYGDKYYVKNVEPIEHVPFAQGTSAEIRMQAINIYANAMTEVRKELGIDKPVEVPTLEELKKEEKAYNDERLRQQKIKDAEAAEAKRKFLEQQAQEKAKDQKNTDKEQEVKNTATEQNARDIDKEQKANDTERTKVDLSEEFKETSASTSQKLDPVQHKPIEIDAKHN